MVLILSLILICTGGLFVISSKLTDSALSSLRMMGAGIVIGGMGIALLALALIG